MSKKAVTKSEMIEDMAELLAIAGLLNLKRIVWLAGLRHLDKPTLTKIFCDFVEVMSKAVPGEAVELENA